MSTPEDDLLKELMRLTDNSEDELKAFISSLKKEVLGGFASGPVSKKAASKEPEYTFENYPHFRPAGQVLKYTLRFTLRGIKPPIWRKVEVPSNISLRHLSELILVVMGWYGDLLNQFRVGQTYYEPAYQRDGDYENMAFSPVRHYNQEDYSIADILTEKGKHVLFDYDFGDSWEHEIRLSSIEDYAEGEPRRIKFLSGKRACPPEDCGGIWGYEELCELLEKRAAGKRLKRDDKERLEWCFGDEDFDPDQLDLDACADAADALNE